MNRRVKVMDEGVEEKTDGSGEVVLVAVDGSRRVSEYALEWALANVVLQQGDKIVLLAVVPSSSFLTESGWRKRWGFPALSGECAAPLVKSPGNDEDLKDVHSKCSLLIEKLCTGHNLQKVHISMEIVQFEERGVVSSEARRYKSTWVVLDRHLKKEAKTCLRDLQCNIVLVNRGNPKILRLNLKRRGSPADDFSADTSSLLLNGLSMCMIPKGFDQLYWEGVTSNSSAPSSPVGSQSSSFDSSTRQMKFNRQIQDTASPTVSSQPLTPAATGKEADRKVVWDALPSEVVESMTSEDCVVHVLSDFLNLDRSSTRSKDRHERQSVDRVFSVRKEMHLPKHSSALPPPLCSICQHKAPVFGKPPRKFTFAELESATGGFSNANFLAEGGFGSVYKGRLSDGQAVAVKQHKLASTQGDKEFCSEVEVLSCAQQRNLVMLIGYCVEARKRLLVYEFVCNGSLDSHLYGNRSKASPLEWSARQKIAVGAARALRYLHEECRVGCIVHRDMRPNNILLTHDFEPMVGDFGLARWQPDGDLAVETRVIGVFGYLAPEYTQTGQITEKADVYSFGIVLLELVTGRKAVDMSRKRGEMCLSEWARPLLRNLEYNGLVDQRLGDKFIPHEVDTMLHTAALCIDPDPSVRPRMSQVLRLLEGDLISHNFESPQSVLSPGNLSNCSTRPSSARLSNFNSSSSSNSGSPLNPTITRDRALFAKYYLRDKAVNTSTGT